MGLMLYVNHAGHEPAWIHHAAWDGLHLADMVMPCFLLLVGLSAALSLTLQRQRGMSRHALFRRCLKRAGEWPWALQPGVRERYSSVILTQQQNYHEPLQVLPCTLGASCLGGCLHASSLHVMKVEATTRMPSV